jgi:tetratricopeptide (TPR) repeat protein
MSKTYRDFPLRVSPLSSAQSTGERQYRVRIAGPVPGGQPAYDEQETRLFDPAVFIDPASGRDLLDLLRRRKITESQLAALGGVLADLLLPGMVRTRLLDSLEVVRPRGQALRLRLIIDAPELAALPWEYLYLKPPGAPDSRKYYLALQPDLSIVRHESLDEAEPDEGLPAQVRLVAALASPAELDPLLLEQDRLAIQELIAGSGGGPGLTPAWVERATRQSLFQALREPSALFHFSGHGLYQDGKGYLVLESGSGQGYELYPGEELGDLLRSAGVRLAVLGACETAQRSGENLWTGVAPLLVQYGVGAVVASQFRLQDRNALPLVSELYRGVLAGESIDQAVQKARQAIYQQSGLENRDWGAPVLYLRLRSGVLFPAASGPAAPAREEAQRVVINVTQQITSVEGGTVIGVQADSIGAWTGSAAGDAVGSAAVREIPRLAPPPLQVPLVGREDELEEALDRLKEGGKYYFHGAFGVGKTSLATELFQRAIAGKPFADGYLWGSLAGMDAEKALEWIASRLKEEAVSRAEGQPAKIDALREALSRRGDLLFGLDEVPDAAVARAVLSAAGECPVILNGNKRLELSGLAREWELEPLTQKEAVELFINQAFPPGAKVSNEDRQHIGEIVTQLRRLPLAVKLAAGKYADGDSLADLEERLRYEPDTLFISDSSLNTIFSALYQDLQNDPAAMRMLMRIASFPALECATDYLRRDETRAAYFGAKDKLTLLGMANPAGRERIALHPVLGLGVWKADTAAMEAERQRSIAWLLEMAHQNRDRYGALEAEHTNLTGLLDLLMDEGRWDELVDLMRDLFEYLRVRGQWQEAFESLETALKADRLDDPWKRGWVSLHHGILHSLRANYDHAAADFKQADQLFEESGDQAYRGKVLYRKASMTALQGDQSGARQQLFQAIQWMETGQVPRDLAGAHTQLAGILVSQGDLAAAREHYAKALALGDPEVQARAHMALAELDRQAGRQAESQEHLEEALQLVTSLGHVLQRATLEQQLGYAHFYEGRYDQALTYFEGSLSAYQELDYQYGVALSLHALGNIYFARKDLASAKRHYEEALAINERLGHGGNAAYNRYGLAVVAHRTGDKEKAGELYRKILAGARSVEDIPLQAAALTQLGSLSYEKEAWDEARQYFQQVKELSGKLDNLAVQATALYYTGLLQAQEGYGDQARETLAQSHAAFAALNSLDAQSVKGVLADLEKKTAGGEPAKHTPEIDLIIKGTGTLKPTEEAPPSVSNIGLKINREDTEDMDVLLRGGPFSGEFDQEEEE